MQNLHLVNRQSWFTDDNGGISSLSFHDVEEVKLTKWRRLNATTDTRELIVTYDDGRRGQIDLFRSRL
jgi:hypothetical protein